MEPICFLLLLSPLFICMIGGGIACLFFMNNDIERSESQNTNSTKVERKKFVCDYCKNAGYESFVCLHCSGSDNFSPSGYFYLKIAKDRIKQEVIE